MSKKSLKHFSIKELQKELARRHQDRLHSLHERKTEIEEEIRSLSGSTIILDGTNSKQTSSTSVKGTKKTTKHKVKQSGATKKRITDIISLDDRIIKIASDGLVHTTSEFAESALKDGWKTSAAKPYYIMAARLANMSKKNILRRVTKGKYQLAQIEQQAISNTVTDNTTNA